MDERLLHYVWKHKLFLSEQMETVYGDPVSIIDIGLHNFDAGPDFFNAKIRIGKTFWAGNVEIHNRSSDWYDHKHHINPIYNTVILHVVKQYDRDIFRSNGELIPQIILSYPDRITENYDWLLNSDNKIPCALHLPEIPSISIISWLGVLLTERLEDKTERIFRLLRSFDNNWESVLYITLGRYFGTGINGDSFERLTRSLPFTCLLRHRDSQLQTDALLFGQAGMLSGEIEDDYFRELKKEYLFLKHKYELQSIDPDCWKAHRLRPYGFPELRIAQFSAFYCQNSGLFSRITEANTLSELYELFRIKPFHYWTDHYHFGDKTALHSVLIGDTLIKTIQINVFIPVIFAYGIFSGRTELSEKALALSEELPPENNFIIRKWKACGINASNASDSQSLIQLKKEYCDLKKCLYCRIGREILLKRNNK